MQCSPAAFSLYAAGAAFCAYTCIFALRKPFTAATFEGLSFAGIDYKIWLITAQVLGYMLSKFIGIKLIAEMPPGRRATSIAIMVAIALMAWVGFAFVPLPYNIVCLFFNGLPLGMGWGLMIGYLEGRRVTEVLGAGLSVSFIFSSGISKTIALWTMNSLGISPFVMPLVVALGFSVPLAGFIWLLEQLPPPSAADEAARTRRQPMSGAARWQFFSRLAGGLVGLILAYILLTIYREFRDNYAAEIWQALGYGSSPQMFTLTETPIAFAVMIAVSLMMLVKNNLQALLLNHAIVGGGFLLVGLATVGFQAGWISPVWWIISVGLGLYLGYVPFNSVLFDRLIATFRHVGNVGFLIYLADSFGYVGSVAVLFYKNFGQQQAGWLSFFIASSYFVSVIGLLLMLASAVYFWQRHRKLAQRAI
ncbi:MAG: DUF5690 family protein [Bernardetiaceae bacterium]|nr:DUF5690 family protein [Bernardetiaceae bacterium]